MYLCRRLVSGRARRLARLLALYSGRSEGRERRREEKRERRRERGKDHFGLYVLRRTNVVFRYRDATMSETLAIIPYNRVSKKKKK